MTNREKMQWVVDVLKRAEIMGLNGSIEIRFSNGAVQNSKTIIHETPLDLLKNKN